MTTHSVGEAIGKETVTPVAHGNVNWYKQTLRRKMAIYLIKPNMHSHFNSQSHFEESAQKIYLQKYRCTKLIIVASLIIAKGISRQGSAMQLQKRRMVSTD